jgi:hypothetical protein
MTLDLTDDEAAALARHLRQAIDRDRFPLAPAKFKTYAQPRAGGKGELATHRLVVVSSPNDQST